MAFCTKCGANIPAGIKFCTSCGTPAGVPLQPVTAVAPAPIPTAYQPVSPPMPAASPQQQPPVMNGNVPQVSGGSSTVMGTGAYIGTMLLFGLPIIGGLACIIMAFAAGNLNRRNFARAMLVFMIIGFVLSIVLYFIFSWMLEAVMQYINESTVNIFGNYQ